MSELEDRLHKAVSRWLTAAIPRLGDDCDRASIKLTIMNMSYDDEDSLSFDVAIDEKIGVMSEEALNAGRVPSPAGS